MNEIKVNVYGESGKIEKTCIAKTTTIKFGTIRAIMRLLQIDTMNDTSEVVSAVYGAWGELVRLLNDCFPDMTEKDWDSVPVMEVVSTVLEILKSSFSDLRLIQGNGSKN